MLYPDPPRNVGTIDALKSFLSTIDSSVDPETINNLTVEEAQKKVLTAISNKSISSNVIAQFSTLFYGANSPFVKEQGNKVSERIKDQNSKENFKQAKIFFLITKALCSKLIKEAQKRAKQKAVNKALAKAHHKKKWALILAAGKYWEELAEFDRISEEKLLALIKKQHQESMDQLRGLKATMSLLKMQLKAIDKYEKHIVAVFSKEIATDLKNITFKDGTSLFKNASDQEMEEIAEEYLERDYELSKEVESLRQEIDEMKQQKASMEEQIKKDTQSSHKTTFFEERKNDKSDNNMGGLAPPPAMLPFKKHQEYVHRSESAHHLSEKLRALSTLIAKREEALDADLNEKENLLLQIAKKRNLHEDVALIESHDAELKEHIQQNIEHKKQEFCDQLDFCYSARAEITDQMKQIKEAGQTLLEEQRENLKELYSGGVKITGETEALLNTYNRLSKELDEFNFDDDEKLELESNSEIKEKTRPRM